MATTNSKPEYEKLSLLGSGGFGNVFLVADKQGRKYAMKEIHFREDNTNLLGFIHREIDTLSDLTTACTTRSVVYCPVIQYIQSYSVGTNTKTIIMQLANGGDLVAHLTKLLSQKNSSPISIKLKLADEIMRGLQFIHSNDIVHGDIKPENILIHDGRIKYSDFGLSCLHTKNCQHVAGTLTHLDPRIVRGKVKSVSFETDMYSLGVLLYNIFQVGQFIAHKPFYLEDDYEINYTEKVNEMRSFTGDPNVQRYYRTSKAFSTEKAYHWGCDQLR
jgi:cyclin-dependent kinase 5